MQCPLVTSSMKLKQSSLLWKYGIATHASKILTGERLQFKHKPTNTFCPFGHLKTTKKLLTMFDVDEVVFLDRGLPTEEIVTIIAFSRKLLVKVEDSKGQMKVVSIYRLSKP